MHVVYDTTQISKKQNMWCSFSAGILYDFEIGYRPCLHASDTKGMQASLAVGKPTSNKYANKGKAEKKLISAHKRDLVGTWAMLAAPGARPAWADGAQDKT